MIGRRQFDGNGLLQEVVAALQRHLRAAPRIMCRGDIFCIALRPCTAEDGILRTLHGIGASGELLLSACIVLVNHSTVSALA